MSPYVKLGMVAIAYIIGSAAFMSIFIPFGQWLQKWSDGLDLNLGIENENLGAIHRALAKMLSVFVFTVILMTAFVLLAALFIGLFILIMKRLQF